VTMAVLAQHSGVNVETSQGIVALRNRPLVGRPASIEAPPVCGWSRGLGKVQERLHERFSLTAAESADA
jgi:hypothetical protein